MKIIFTIALGSVLGWATAVWDAEGQLALEQHQLKVNEVMYQAATQNVEEEKALSKILYLWP
ncbi:hypothetical protein [Rufibacter sp. XAAS-G3-1]|uniref:hypothetical protein n=1 Tax=Rufibacter sp. XAAS-G3-1 TaxID=2729134 RepID=UPI0015E663E8|nr:hypothetical protein [Rufibacter sp. XAAS-G3-1]